MQLSFFGAAREVTGSCYLVETTSTRILIDCGMFQGSSYAEARNFDALPFDAASIDAVCVTHAHLDHTGRLPKLIKDGFKGKIYATPPTVKLTELVLDDAEQVMLEDFKREYRPPLYEKKDVAETVRRFSGVKYKKAFSVGDCEITLFDAGHIFGSAFIQIKSPSETIVFSGDIGNEHAAILRDTDQLPATDALVLESTYGNRSHESESLRSAKLREAIIKTAERNGALIIPAFAIERTQQLLHELHHLTEEHLIPRLDVYLDSPLAIEASGVVKSFPEYYDQEAFQHVTKGEDMLSFSGLHICRTRDDSKTINAAPNPKIVIAGAGMMNGGRIRHHLVRYLGDPASTVLIVGHQAKGTLGHQLYRGDKHVHVLGHTIDVRATITTIGAYSGHGDQNKLLRWIQSAPTLPKHIFCTHGEEDSCLSLAKRLEIDFSIHAHAPRLNESVMISV
ncbi:MBL fold metallo-hydrolase [Candidatus Uhrbacteria bacterium]|nr:MBL fold metallo-hydrolase [Candidatus Uhrbacteria bacterium]